MYQLVDETKYQEHKKKDIRNKQLKARPRPESSRWLGVKGNRYVLDEMFLMLQMTFDFLLKTFGLIPSLPARGLNFIRSENLRCVDSQSSRRIRRFRNC